MIQVTRFLCLVLLASVIAFFIYRKKQDIAMENAGEGYEEDSTYISISKTKKIIEIVCIVSLCTIGVIGAIEDSSHRKSYDKQVAQTTEKKTEKTSEEIATENRAIENAIHEGWDKKNQRDEEYINARKALTLIKDYPDYIPSQQGEPIDPQKALREPWVYYGKVVSLNGIIYSIKNFPPDHEVTKHMEQDCFHAMVVTDDKVYFSVYIVGTSDGIENMSIVTLKGYVTGLEELQHTTYGGKNNGVSFIGQGVSRQRPYQDDGF